MREIDSLRMDKRAFSVRSLFDELSEARKSFVKGPASP